MGALVGLVVANRAPERVRSLTLVDHAGHMDASAVDAVRAGLARLDAVVASPDAYVAAIRDALADRALGRRLGRLLPLRARRARRRHVVADH